MAPALRIPVSLDMKSLQDQTKQASDRVGETLKGIGKAFQQVNGEMLGIAKDTAGGIALSYSQSAVKSVLAFSTIAAGAVAATKIITGAIDLTSEKIKEMVDIADKSRDSGVSPQFFQAFLSESQKFKVSADDLEGALKKAFDATKEQSPIDLGKWETGEERITDVEKALRVYNETFARTKGQQLDGLVLFRDADNVEKKAIAVLQAMIQLNGLGQNLAALDLGEKMFGAQFVDRIRQGRTSAEEMLESIKAAQVASDGMFSNETVQRAKDIDTQLKSATAHLDREMRPTLEGLANTMLSIKSAWADVVELMAKAAALVGKVNVSDIVNFVANPVAGVASVVAKNMLGLNGGDASKAGVDIPQITINSRGAGARPTLKQDTQSDGRDRFDSAADNVEKRTASLKAETDNINLNTEARERARIVAELETVAKQANAAAGLGENVVTEEQTKRINEVADAYGRAALAIENARSPLATFARESANLGKALNQFAASSLDTITNELASVVTGTKTASEAFKAMAASIINDLARIAIRKTITGPLAGILGFGFSEGGAVPGFDIGGFTGRGGKYEPAGVVHRGEYVFDAAATNRIGVANLERLRRGYADGGYVDAPSVIPANVRPAMASQATVVNISSPINAPGADQATLMRVLSAQQQMARDLPKTITTVMRTSQVRRTRG